jgi:hypothetical protein
VMAQAMYAQNQFTAGITCKSYTKHDFISPIARTKVKMNSPSLTPTKMRLRSSRW